MVKKNQTWMDVFSVVYTHEVKTASLPLKNGLVGRRSGFLLVYNFSGAKCYTLRGVMLKKNTASPQPEDLEGTKSFLPRKSRTFAGRVKSLRRSLHNNHLGS